MGFRALALTVTAITCTYGMLLPGAATAGDKYGIGSGASLVLLKSTLSVSFKSTFFDEPFPSCLLAFDGVASQPTGGFIRYTGAFGRSAKYPDFPAILLLSTAEVSGANVTITPTRPYYGYIKTPYFSGRGKVGRRRELPPNSVIVEFNDGLWMQHLFYSMLEERKVTLVLAKQEGGIEHTMPVIDLAVVESMPSGSQVRSDDAMTAFRKCMKLENRPPTPGNEYKFWR